MFYFPQNNVNFMILTFSVRIKLSYFINQALEIEIRVLREQRLSWVEQYAM
jgi:hypothetical protein